MGWKMNLGLLICVLSRQVSKVPVSVPGISHWCLEFGRVKILTARGDAAAPCWCVRLISVQQLKVSLGSEVPNQHILCS